MTVDQSRTFEPSRSHGIARSALWNRGKLGRAALPIRVFPRPPRSRPAGRGFSSMLQGPPEDSAESEDEVSIDGAGRQAVASGKRNSRLRVSAVSSNEVVLCFKFGKRLKSRTGSDAPACRPPQVLESIPLEEGILVRLQWLQAKPQLNDTWATLVKYDPVKTRWVVELFSTQDHGKGLPSRGWSYRLWKYHVTRLLGMSFAESGDVGGEKTC